MFINIDRYNTCATNIHMESDCFGYWTYTFDIKKNQQQSTKSRFFFSLIQELASLLSPSSKCLRHVFQVAKPKLIVFELIGFSFLDAVCSMRLSRWVVNNYFATSTAQTVEMMLILRASLSQSIVFIAQYKVQNIIIENIK